jgi:hypothetical protein
LLLPREGALQAGGIKSYTVDRKRGRALGADAGGSSQQNGGSCESGAHFLFDFFWNRISTQGGI